MKTIIAILEGENGQLDVKITKDMEYKEIMDKMVATLVTVAQFVDYDDEKLLDLVNRKLEDINA